ncbi:MAG: type II secretion system protein GspD [Candidatus Omnitrophica bacterium]|nr:type II secretion system protein GspD [Candidatus Omnitrophota bacterium]
MKRNAIIQAIMVVALTFSFCTTLDAEESLFPAKGVEGTEELSARNRVSLSLRNIDITEALKFFAIRSGFNIIPTPKVSGRVTLNVENVPVLDLFDLMLRSNNLAYEKRGEIYNVMTEAEYKQLFGRNFSDTRAVKVFRLKYAIPEQAFNMLDALKSDIGRLLVEAESGAIMFMDTPEKIQEATKALEMLEQKATIRVFDLKYAKAKDVEDQLKAQIDLKKVGMVRADERTNQIIVQTLPERMSNIEGLIKSLDKKTKAVMIDVKIIKIKLTRENDEGVQWEGLFSLARQYGLTYLGSYPFSNMVAGITNPTFTSREQVARNVQNAIGQYPFSGTTSSLDSSVKTTAGKNMHLGMISGKQDFDAVVNFLQTLGKSKIIASPAISVINNQEAKIHIGERRAFVTTTTTTGTTTKTVSEEVTYVDVGVQLSVTPLINEDGYITMKVKPEISSVVNTLTTSSGNVVPIIDQSTAETTVIAKDRSTVIIGGLGKEEKVDSGEYFPVLGKIPVLGFLFKNETKKLERIELVVMLTPIIVEGDRFITPASIEKFEVKPVKQFDVFRPESAMPSSQTQGGLVSVTEAMKLKNVKSYNEDQELKVKPLEKAASASIPLERGVPAKGFKPYN